MENNSELNIDIILRGDQTDIMPSIKKIYLAGKVAVVYQEGDNAVVDTLICELDRAGYTVKRIAYPNDVIINEEALADIQALPEEIRYLIGVGGRSITELLKLGGRKYSLYLTKLDSALYLNAGAILGGDLDWRKGALPSLVIIDKNAVTSGASRSIASAYGTIIACYTYLLDNRFKQCFMRSVNREIYSKLETLLDRYFGVNIDRNNPYCLDKLIEVNMELAKLISYIPPELLSIDKQARLVANDYSMELDMAEFSALGTLYIYAYSSGALSEYSENLLYPSDLSYIIEDLARTVGMSAAVMFKALPSISAEVILTRDYVLREYLSELKEFATAKLIIIKQAVSNMRRLYDDAGLKLSKAIEYNDLTRRVKATCLYSKEYSLMKHFMLMGVNL